MKSILALAVAIILVLTYSNYGTVAQSGEGPPPSPKTVFISFNQFSSAVTRNGHGAPSQAQYNAFHAGLSKGKIETVQEAAMALAQFIHESDGLKAKREYACQRDNCPGSYRTPGCDHSGQYYFGRGYIQLSWCENYKAASWDLFRDDRLVRDPDMVARSEKLAWDTAFWYWGKRVHIKPEVRQGRFGSSTRAINGGIECDQPTGWNTARKRYQIYGQVRAAFGLPGRGNERGCYPV